MIQVYNRTGNEVNTMISELGYTGHYGERPGRHYICDIPTI